MHGHHLDGVGGILRRSIGLARVAGVLALVAVTAYIIDCWVRVLPAMEPTFTKDPFMGADSFRAIGAGSIIGSWLMVAVPIGVLLWGLRAARGRGDRS